MKKSSRIILSAVLLGAIESCSSSGDNWTTGTDQAGHVHDTAINKNGVNHYYRYYGGGWYVLHRNGMINTGGDMPANASDISRPGFSPRAASGGIETGGFGHSAHGEGGGGE